MKNYRCQIEPFEDLSDFNRTIPGKTYVHPKVYVRKSNIKKSDRSLSDQEMCTRVKGEDTLLPFFVIMLYY
jgi:hypothetical protein